MHWTVPSLSYAPWPAFDPEVLVEETQEIPVQVNGKVRSRLNVPAETSESELQQLALADPAVLAHTTGRTVKKVVVAKGRLVSVVVQ